MSQLPGARKNAGSDPFGAPPLGYVPGRGRGAVGFAGGVSRDDGPEFQRETVDLNESNYNPETGYSENLFGNDAYDEDDRKADDIYAEIDARMDNRRKRKREEKLREQLLQERNEKPTIHDQLADVKRGLASVSLAEWEAIPDAQVYNIKKQKRVINVPVPDLILKERDKGSHSNLTVLSEGPNGIKTPISGMNTPMGLMTPGLLTPNAGGRSVVGGPGGGRLNELGEVKGQLLTVKLDRVIDQVSGQTVIDPKGYLTQLDTAGLNATSNLDDMKKGRMLLRSVTKTNPSHAPGWIAAAKLEEGAGEIEAARSKIKEGCEANPKNAELWLEAIRLAPGSKAMEVLNKALSHLPYSVPLWVECVSRTNIIDEKKRLLKKAVAFIPNSAKLWKDAIELEDNPEDKKSILSKAVKCLSKGDVEAVQMWLDFANVCTYHEARKVLNDARKAIPTSPEIWVAAAKLEENNGNEKMPQKMLAKAIPNLSLKGAVIDRENWLTFAQDAERDGFPVTCEAIIVGGHQHGVERVTRMTTWLDEAQECVRKRRFATARFILRKTAQELPSKDEVWEQWIQLEMTHGSETYLTEVLEEATKHCPEHEVFWLMRAKHVWKTLGQSDEAQKILNNSLAPLVGNEHALGNIYLALAKIDWEIGNVDSARKRYAESRVTIKAPGTAEKILMQSIQLERYAYSLDRSEETKDKILALCNESIKLYPKCWKLWAMYAQSVEAISPSDTPEACKAMHEKVSAIYKNGVNENSAAVHLWRDAVRFQQKFGNYGKATAMMDNAKLHNLNDPILIYTELELVAKMGASGNINAQKNLHSLIAAALKAVPNSGLLWHFAVNHEEPRKQSTIVTDGLKVLERDPYVVWAGAEVFWKQGMYPKARKWFHHAVSLNDKVGDIWGSYVAFELLNGNEKTQRDVINKASLASPGINRGFKWNSIVKTVEMWRALFVKRLRLYLQEHHKEALESDKVHDSIKNVLTGDE